MRKLYTIFILLFTASILSACGSDSSSGSTTTSPHVAACAGNTACIQSVTTAMNTVPLDAAANPNTSLVPASGTSTTTTPTILGATTTAATVAANPATSLVPVASVTTASLSPQAVAALQSVGEGGVTQGATNYESYVSAANAYMANPSSVSRTISSLQENADGTSSAAAR